jgi:nucleotide-binding universal stress UspA family protein
LRAIGRRVAGPGIEVRRGWVIDELLETVAPGDLVVMASQGHGFVESRLFGSVTEAMLKDSPAPVEFVRVTRPAGRSGGEHRTLGVSMRPQRRKQMSL